jgi:hypothetical protein
MKKQDLAWQGWKELENKYECLEVYSYTSIPTMQAICDAEPDDSEAPNAALGDLLGSESVDRRSRRFEQRKININLAAMMDFVLHHGAQPLAHWDGSAVGSGAAALQIFSCEVG